MKLGIFGGSFDPPHWGHIRPVRTARRQLGLERVIYLPTAQPPHKPDRRLTPAWARFCMVELALLREEGLYASTHELTPGRRAYTVETLEHFRRRYPDADLHLLMGSDSFAELAAWRRWRRLPELAQLVVLERPGSESASVRAAAPREVLELLADGRARLLAGEPVDLSSTELRARLGRGESPPPGVVPELVLDYIDKYALYR